MDAVAAPQPLDLLAGAAFEIGIEQFRLDGDDEKPRAGIFGPFHEGRRIERPVGACHARRQHLHHQRDIGAPVAAEGEQRALHGGGRVGGRVAGRVERPAFGDGIAVLGRLADIDESGGAGGLVDDQRRAVAQGSGEG